MSKSDRRQRDVDVFTSALAHHLATLEARVEGVRRGTDPEDLHKFRVASRRLRSVLKAARPWLNQSWAAPLEEDAKWLCRQVGPARDLDVLIHLIGHDAAEIAEGEAFAIALEPFLEDLDARRSAARQGMLDAIDADRYARFMKHLEVATHGDDEIDSHLDLVMIAAGEYHRFVTLANAVSESPHGPSDFHRLRIRAKRARYAADLAAPIARPRARSFIHECIELQDLLGDQHDAHVAFEALVSFAARGNEAEPISPETRQAADRLAAFERAKYDELAERIPMTIEKVIEAGSRAWM